MIRSLLFLLALILAAPAAAAKPLFASQAPLSISIEAPFDRMFRNRESEEPADGSLTDPAGNRLPVTVELRGITRRTADICAFPPLAIRFSAPPPASSPFAGEKKLKLVTHCRNTPSFDRVVLLEYAAYRLYQSLTPRSFGARLATIRYVDLSGRAIATRPAFFIEDLKDVAARNGTAEFRAGPRIPTADLNAADSARYAVFQHMIANHDWSMRAGPVGDNCCHNAKLIGAPGAGNAIPIPYDFDYSGLVNAPYATPPEQLKLRSVRDRQYRGYCVHNPQVAEAARAFRSKRPAFEAELRAIPGLDPRAAASAIAFIAIFFAEIATDQEVDAKLLKRCIG
ncbi:MAG: hypothetical protein ABIS39_03775 [Sphingomicrobium sp.]